MENEPNGVDVEISNATLTQASLHRCLLRRAGCNVVEPVRINGASGSCQDPGKSGAGVVLVHDVDLGCDLRGTAELHE